MPLEIWKLIRLILLFENIFSKLDRTLITLDAVGALVQYFPRNMHTVCALLCFVVVIHWLIYPYPSGLLHWHCGNLTIAPVPAKQPWWIWINTSCELIMNDCITTTKQSTTKPCAYFLGYTVHLNCYRIDCNVMLTSLVVKRRSAVDWWYANLNAIKVLIMYTALEVQNA